MEKGPLAELLVERYEEMPPQLQVAARFVLDHPRDVALMSMREQAHQAGVSHTTMMRLARWLGLDGYEDMRSLYAKAMRSPGYAQAETSGLARPEADDGGYGTVGVVADVLAAQVARLGEYGLAAQLMEAADMLSGSRRMFSLGFRLEHPVAHHFAYVLSQLGRSATLLDTAGGLGVDALREAGEGDAVLAIGMAPYARATVEMAMQAAHRNVTVIAVTDSSVSPLARLAKMSVVVTSDSRSAFKSVVPAIAAVEILAALIAAKSGEAVSEAVGEVERQLTELGVYWRPPR